MRIPWLAALLLAGCATTPGPAPKPVAVLSGPLPANATVIGQVRGFSLDDLEEQARARGGDAITVPTTVTMRGLMESNVLKRP